MLVYNNMKYYFILFLTTMIAVAFAAPQHCRDCCRLPVQEQEFANHLSIIKRKIFCGKFSEAQRQTAMQYARGSLSPEEAVVRVMQETGMSLAVKSRRQCEE